MFNNQVYKQTKHVLMGLPISNSVAEWKTRLLENSFMQNFKNQLNIWVRYGNDVFVIINKFFDLPSLLYKLNYYDPNIRFNIELENYDVLAFLDVRILRSDRNLRTTVCRKPNFNSNIVSTHSETPFPYKMTPINFYNHRALKVCSIDELLNIELSTIEKIARKSGYSNKSIMNVIDETFVTYNTIQPAQKVLKFTNPIPFMRDLSLKSDLPCSKYSHTFLFSK